MINKENKIILFENTKVRRHRDDEKELWFFSIVDVIEILTESKNSQVYWRVLKKRLLDEGSNETVTKCNGLKMIAKDGKMRRTDVANTETILRLIQSIPSPKAEPFKLWLAKVGYERIEETEDPELGINRAMQTYLKKGYSKDWVNQRLKTIDIRNELTDEWKERGIKKGFEFAILTDEITKAWSGKSVKQYKKFKGLKKENLRDNMSNLELVLNMLAEVSTTEISKKKKPEGFEENKKVANRGGSVAKQARLAVEEETGESVATSENAKNMQSDKFNSISINDSENI